MTFLSLRPDNFTPPSRTPWGGTRIVQDYKGGPAGKIVGESWEISVEPDFPSTLTSGQRLADVLTPEMLGVHARLGGSPLLVKLLDAAAPLSLQIHPSDDDPALSDGESGKPEAWYVLRAEEGAGLYLGLKPGVTEVTLREAIECRGDVEALLHFEPVAPGDYFFIEPGTPHAIGPGLTLVEPQRVLPGKRGLTYRYWDWNRLYDEHGKASPDGSPRELHLDRALEVTRWSESGPDLVARVRTRAGAPAAAASIQELDRGALFTDRLSGTGTLHLAAEDRLFGYTCVAGEARFASDSSNALLRKGESGIVPAGVACEIELQDALVIRSAVGSV